MIDNRFRNKIISILIFLIFVVSVIFVYLMHYQQNKLLENLIEKEKVISKKIYSHTLKTLYEKYIFIASSLLLNESIQRAVAEKDHDKLLILTQHYYEKFRDDNPYLDIMHFHTPQTTSLLRLHKPDTYGDDLSKVRPIVVQTNLERKIHIGLEVGKYGTDYRVAVPINYHGKHVGVLEFGINAEYIVNTLSKYYELDSILLLDDKQLDIYYQYNTKVKKEKIGDFIIFSSTFFPATTVKGIEGITSESTKTISYFGVDHIIFQATDLINYNKEVIGKVHLVKNIDFFTSSAASALMTVSFSVFIVIILAYFLTRYGFNYFIKRIDEQQKMLVEKNELLENLINIDHLTKAYNRRRIDEILKTECKRTQRYDNPLSIILFDIDNFKKINDTYGHNKGDKVLRIIAKTIAHSIRESDYFGRWGGEEFIIVTTSTTLEDATLLAKKIQEIIADLNFNEMGQITCSFGVASCDEGDTIEQAVHKADEALYQAKAQGKNCVVTWEYNA